MTTLSRNALRAVYQCSAEKDIRYYLNGVCIECRNSVITMTATDGHVLLAYRETQAQETEQTDFSVIIPNEICAGVKAKGSANVELLPCDDRTWKLSDSVSSIVFVPVDGTFPDWRRIVPRKVDGTAGSYNVELLALFGKAAKEMGSKAQNIHVHQNGPDKAALVEFYCSPDLIGVIMPKRESVGEFNAPDWI